MALTRGQKEVVVVDMTDRLKGAEVVVLTDYRGLSVGHLAKLRTELRKSGAEFFVIKNSLAKRAMIEAGITPPEEMLTGPTALLLVGENLSASAKALQAFMKDHPQLDVKGGIMGEHRLDAKGVKALAELPTRDELLSMFMGVLQAPQTQFVTVLSAPMRNFVSVLSNKAKQAA